MNFTTLAIHSSFLVLTIGTALGTALAVRWRIRRLAVRSGASRPGVDPLVNACVRGGAALALALVVGWLSATAPSISPPPQAAAAKHLRQAPVPIPGGDCGVACTGHRVPYANGKE